MIHPAATLASTRRLLERALSAAVTPLCLMAAIVLSYALRFEGLLDDKALESLRWALVLVPPIQWAVLVVFAERSRSLRGLALRDLWRIVFGVLAGLAVAACVATVAGLRIPRSIWVIDWFVATSILGGLRGLGCELKDLLARRGDP